MDIIKKSIEYLLGGALVVTGAFLAMEYIVVPLSMEDEQLDSIYKERLVNVEKDIGKPCLDVHSEAVNFSENDIKEIINQGQNGNDWIEIITNEQRQFILKTEKNLFDCKIVQHMTSYLGEKWPDFDGLYLVYARIKKSLNDFGNTPESIREQKLNALDHLIYLHETHIK